MKNGSPCPKCGATQVLRLPGKLYDRIPIGVTLFSAVPVTQYLCRQCGYLERWIDSPADRERLVRRYGRKRGG